MPGNITTFDKIDIMRCFLLLHEKCSREQLKDRMQLGEGSVRGILRILKDKGYIDSSRQGHVHNKKGENVFVKLSNAVEFPIICDTKFSSKFLKEYFPIFAGDRVVAGKVFDYDKDLKHIHIYRDYAIKAGADGALMLVYLNGRLGLPGYDDFKGFEFILDSLRLEKDCLVLLAVAETVAIGERSILNVLVHIRPELGKLF